MPLNPRKKVIERLYSLHDVSESESNGSVINIIIDSFLASISFLFHINNECSSHPNTKLTHNHGGFSWIKGKAGKMYRICWVCPRCWGVCMSVWVWLSHIFVKAKTPPPQIPFPPAPVTTHFTRPPPRTPTSSRWHSWKLKHIA